MQRWLREEQGDSGGFAAVEMLCSAVPSAQPRWCSGRALPSSTGVDIPQVEPVIHGGPFSTASPPVPSSLWHSVDALTLVRERETSGAVYHLMLRFLAFFFLFISLPFSSPR